MGYVRFSGYLHLGHESTLSNDFVENPLSSTYRNSSAEIPHQNLLIGSHNLGIRPLKLQLDILTERVGISL